MHPIAILLIGVVIVITGVLAFRLHAFLALVLAALVVGSLTPQSAIEGYWIKKSAIEFSVHEQFIALHLKDARMGDRYLVLSENTESGRWATSGTLEVFQVDPENPPNQSVQVRAPEGTSVSLDVEKNLVISPGDFDSANKSSKQTVGERVSAAFGSTCGKIGILIALAAIIGKCLLDSGSADRIVRSAMKVVGEKGAPTAFVGSGFLLGIPVFFDTVFYLMIPLAKALRMRTGRDYILFVLCIVAGGSMAHSLVPPTPGPLFVADELGVDLGLMIIAGTMVGLCSSTAAFFYAHWVNRRHELPLRESPDFTLKDVEEIAQRDEKDLPPLSLSLLPIVLPVVLIAGYTVVNSFELLVADSSLLPIAKTLGNKNIALAIATAIAMGTLVWHNRTSLRNLSESIQGALASGGVIILITAGGGAFGGMLQQTGVASLINDLPNYSPLVIIVLAFFITTAIRTAQGSATVAMITAVGVLSGFASGDVLGCHPVYLALAIGCGSKPVAWMNDSGFWVICKMSGMTEAEGLRYITPMSILMGIVGLTATLIGAAFIPIPY